MKRPITSVAALILALAALCRAESYRIVDTAQSLCYSDRGVLATPPKPGEPFYGQDAQHPRNPPAYRDNTNGTVTDLVTGLTWVKARGQKMTWDDAIAAAKQCRVGGHADWRVPTIKELYSLINFNGGCWNSADSSRPYIDTRYFDFVFGDESKGERIIDSQDWSATEYLETTMDGNPTVFGVNFADGRIKGYPKSVRDGRKHRMYVRFVRDNPAYGKNAFHDNGDGTLTDRATGLIWQKADSAEGMNWQQALAYAQSLQLAGQSDWRLPTAKELQSILDYTRIPAIDPIFQISKLPEGDHPFYWTGTTHLDGPPDRQGGAGVYVCFGRGTGYLQRGGEYKLRDVHGAGAQRSDPKTGDPSAFPHGRGPQGDVVRINNFVRCVRGGATVKPGEIDPSALSVITPRPSIGTSSRENGPGVSRDPIGPTPRGEPEGFRLLRRFQSEPMNLTPEQQAKIAQIEQETKTRLQKILTPQQMKALETARPPMPGGGPGGPGGGAPGGGAPGEGPNRG